MAKSVKVSMRAAQEENGKKRPSERKTARVRVLGGFLFNPKASRPKSKGVWFFQPWLLNTKPIRLDVMLL